MSLDFIVWDITDPSQPWAHLTGSKRECQAYVLESIAFTASLSMRERTDWVIQPIEYGYSDE